jgi:hypothetical protein
LARNQPLAGGIRFGTPDSPKAQRKAGSTAFAKKAGGPDTGCPPAARGRFMLPMMRQLLAALMPLAAMTSFSHSNKPRRARVTARVGATLGTACPRHLASAIHPPPPPCAPAGGGRLHLAPDSQLAVTAPISSQCLSFVFLPRRPALDRPNWLHEVKYDGYRLRLERDSDRVHTSRRTEGASATVSESLRGYLSSARDCQRSARRRLTCQNHHPRRRPQRFWNFRMSGTHVRFTDARAALFS